MAAATGEASVDDGAPPLGVLYSFGTPWPEFNQGLSYTDTFRCADAGAGSTLIQFYATNYKSSAPLPGWINRIRNGQITVDAEVVSDPNLNLRDGSKLVYHRLPWQEPFAPYRLEVLYEDDDMVLAPCLARLRGSSSYRQSLDKQVILFGCSELQHRKPIIFHAIAFLLVRELNGLSLEGKPFLVNTDTAYRLDYLQKPKFSSLTKWQSLLSNARMVFAGDPNTLIASIFSKVALNKPSGLQVLPKGLFQQRTVLAQLQLRDWKMTSSCHSRRKDLQSHPVPVHRLGRGTSGLLLCAKTKVAKVCLASYFAEGATNAANKRDKSEFGEERKISKFYRALVTGILDNDEVVVTQPIGLVHYPRVAEGLYAACSSGKPAMSKVCVLERLAHENHTLVQVEIHSGRPHQIRIHLAYIGHPLVDDPLYGIGGHPKFVEPETTVPDSSFAYDGGYERPSQPVPGDCGYHLHAHWLVLCHPTTNKMVKITAPLPPILQTREERSGALLSK